MRAVTMAEFFTRAGGMLEHWLDGLTVHWRYEFGHASFDGARWAFHVAEGVRP